MRIFLLLFVLIISGCAKNFNHEVATYKVVDNRYYIELTGERGNMAHDPISLLFRGSSEVSEIINVPRITGVVYGHEIPTKKGYYKYLGKITFADNNMNIDLQYDNYDYNTTPDTGWNGNYVLRRSN